MQVSRGWAHLDDLDLNPILAQADAGDNARYCTLEGRNEVPDTLDAQMILDAAPVFSHGEKMQLAYNIRNRTEEHTSELQSLMRTSYAVVCFKKKQKTLFNNTHTLRSTLHIIDIQ